MEKCEFVLRIEDEECICNKAHHNLFNFGNYGKNKASDMFISYYYFNDEIDDQDYELFLNPWTVHEKYNNYTNEECLCCKIKLLKLNTYTCDDCGCYICGNCFIQGRYSDIKYCYNCRKFGYEKNIWFYTSYHQSKSVTKSIEIIKNAEWYYKDTGDYDWGMASWYY